MLEKIIIHNFESHEHTEMDLVDGINTIIGLPESGKTRILKAIEWVIKNRPIGDAIRRIGSKSTYVSLLFSDGNEVIRFKDNRENSYILNGMEFKAVGIYVPEEVEKVINMNYINFQSQFDPHFLLSNTPSEIASFFNKIANVEKIDDSIIRVNSKIKKIDSELKYEEERKSKIEERIKMFDPLQDFEDEVEKVERISELIDRIENSINKINEISESYDDLDKLITINEAKLLLKPKVDKGFKLLKDSEEISKEISSKESLIYELSYYEKEIIRLKKEKNKLEKELKDNFPEHCPLCGK